MALPKDPFILFSVLNMKLRDEYSSIDLLCDDLGEDKAEIIGAMRDIGFEYDEDSNQFK
jgi:hypothetical protein